MTINAPALLEWPFAQPVEANRVLAGNPATSSITLYKDDRAHAGYWRATPGEFTTAHHGHIEFITILEGSGRLIKDNGEITDLSPGVLAVFDEGWTGRWVIDTELVKSFSIIPTT